MQGALLGRSRSRAMAAGISPALPAMPSARRHGIRYALGAPRSHFRGQASTDRNAVVDVPLQGVLARAGGGGGTGAPCVKTWVRWRVVGAGGGPGGGGS